MPYAPLATFLLSQRSPYDPRLDKRRRARCARHFLIYIKALIERLEHKAARFAAPPLQVPARFRLPPPLTAPAQVSRSCCAKAGVSAAVSHSKLTFTMLLTAESAAGRSGLAAAKRSRASGTALALLAVLLLSCSSASASALSRSKAAYLSAIRDDELTGARSQGRRDGARVSGAARRRQARATRANAKSLPKRRGKLIFIKLRVLALWRILGMLAEPA